MRFPRRHPGNENAKTNTTDFRSAGEKRKANVAERRSGRKGRQDAELACTENEAEANSDKRNFAIW